MTTARMKAALLLLLCLVVVCPCAGYKMFQELIPNGDRVPNPCKANFIWKGVGHLAAGGGGARNPFGLDFYKNGKKWDRCLCEADSDGDGKTNGEELGDPRCVWTPGSTPERTGSSLSHPGICEPLDDPMCRVHNEKFGDICEAGETENSCLEDLRKQDGVLTWDLIHPNTKVPPKETTYMCQTFDVPDVTRDYHVIGSEPRIDNDYVVHHIVLFARDETADEIAEPTECNMAGDACRYVIAGWSVGANGKCLSENFGHRIGKSGYKRVMMQTHWNNPNERDDYIDGSGLRLYYTSNLRTNDGAVLITGQNYLSIPGNRRDVRLDGVCTSECTKNYPHPIYLVSSNIHMHYLGHKGYIEHLRDGEVINTLVSQDSYSYDSPVEFYHDPIIEFLPGDEIRTVCHYKSISWGETTYYGNGTAQEMCLGFITYYPAMRDMHLCIQYRDTPVCERPNISNLQFGECEYSLFWNKSEAIIRQLWSVCDVTGATCSQQCKETLNYYRSTEPCMSGDAYYFTQRLLQQYTPNIGQTIFNLLESCEPKDNVTPVDEKPEPETVGTARQDGGLCANIPEYPGASSAMTVVPSLLFVMLFSLFM